MKGLALDVYQFYLFNYEDWLRLFEDEKNIRMSQMDEVERERFNPYHFDYKETQKLFKKYTQLIICPDDTIWGVQKETQHFLDYKEGVYKCALCYFNKDLLI